MIKIKIMCESKFNDYCSNEFEISGIKDFSVFNQKKYKEIIFSGKYDFNAGEWKLIDNKIICSFCESKIKEEIKQRDCNHIFEWFRYDYNSCFNQMFFFEVCSKCEYEVIVLRASIKEILEKLWNYKELVASKNENRL